MSDDTASRMETLRQAVQDKNRERDNLIRESWVKAMEARLVREELEKCHKGEGVNHYENCKWLADKYLSKMQEGRVQGYKKIDVQ